MPETTAAAAARAAVAAAAGSGVTGTEPVILADGANVIVHLSPAPVVAKVAATTAEVRSDPAAWTQHPCRSCTAIPPARTSPVPPATLSAGCQVRHGAEQCPAVDLGTPVIARVLVLTMECAAAMCSAHRPIRDLLDRYRPENETEAADLERLRVLAAGAEDPWQRSLPLHLTASALIVDRSTARVLLRWHQRQQAWLQVGGHADPGESDPVAIALREAAEETGLTDLVPWPDAQIRHVVIVPVPPSSREPAHEHADLRLLLATRAPDTARPETPADPVRWLSLNAAREVTAEANLRETLSRLERLLEPGIQGSQPAPPEPG